MNYLRRKVVVEFSMLTLLATMATAKSAPEFDLKLADPGNVIQMLKIMRSPEYGPAAPALLPLLNYENPNIVRDTCRTLAVIANKDVIPSIEPLLNDKRPAVRKDAQDAINKLRTDPRPAYDPGTKKTAATLAESDPRDVIRMLKLLRNPAYSAAVPVILPFLNNKNANVVRDACRTLAVIANKDVIPSIEPLVQDKRSAVQKDAQDAINKLRAKP